LQKQLHSIRAKNVKVLNNEYLYRGGEDDDEDEYGFVNSGATQCISASQVHVDKKLADGKFAVIKTGTLTVNNEMHPVAVKMLKRRLYTPLFILSACYTLFILHVDL